MLECLLNPEHYWFNPHAVPLFLVSAIIFWIGLFILLQAKKVLSNISFFLLCLSFSIWLFSMGIVYLANNAQTALILYKCFTFFGVSNIMPCGYFFSVASSAGFSKTQRRNIIIIFILANIFYLLALLTEKLITNPQLYFWGYYPHYEPLAFLFIVFFLIIFVSLEMNLWRNYKKEKNSIRKTQIFTFYIGFMIAFTASGDFIAKFWNIPLYPYGYFSLFIFTCLLAYSIIRYKVFDIETVIHKTILWILSFFLIFLPVFLVYEWLRFYIQGSRVLQLLFWMISFVFFSVYLRVIQPKIDHFFQRRLSNFVDISSQFTQDLVHLKGLEQLIQRIENVLAGAFYPQCVEIFICDEGERKFRLVSTQQTSKELRVLKVQDEHLFLQWLSKNNSIVYQEFIDIDPLYHTIKAAAKEYFRQTATTVVIPFVLNEKLLGIIHLGRKSNLRRYNATDFKFLTLLKNQATIAISNSLLYENIEKQVRQRSQELITVQNQLVQAEKLATVGTLAGGVAHEINNPLAAILMSVQMLIDSDTIDDESDKESLELIEEATKRCQDIVRKLMFYARKPLESKEMSVINLLGVVNKVVSFIGYQLKQENINLHIQAEDKEYTVIGDHNELEHVVTNIILNAKDAIKKVKKSGNIDIYFSKSEGQVELRIKDEGEGIPSDAKAKIFDPFFTTKDIGRGLGLGLSICQAIIQRHNGDIKVKSQLGKGAVFTIKLKRAIGIKSNS